MRILLLIPVFCYCADVLAQASNKNDSTLYWHHHSGAIEFDQFRMDTLYLMPFTAKKMVAYKYATVTLYVDYREYFGALKVLWNQYKHGMKRDGPEKDGFTEAYSNYRTRWLLLDTVYRSVRKAIKTQDTVWLDHAIFERVGFASVLDFSLLIEKGRCNVYDQLEKVKQPMILRQKGSWYRGPLAAFGGRRYYLPGTSVFFYEAMDWIS